MLTFLMACVFQKQVGFNVVLQDKLLLHGYIPDM